MSSKGSAGETGEIFVSSRDNPVYRRLKKLADSARARREARMTLLDGVHLVEACLDAGGSLHTLVRATSADASVLFALSERSPGVRRICLSDALFADLSPVATPSGILAEAGWFMPAPHPGQALVVVLEAIQDPGNLGAMLRTAAAAGATRAILSPGCHDPWSPKALRGGQGAQFVLPVETAVDLTDWLSHFAGDCLALTLEGSSSLYDRDLARPLAIIVGNEGAGLSPAVCHAADARVRIPMHGRVESLNAGAALAVALFEAARQRS
ncbi:MAG TPA: RNA methyltransferase [Thiobacillus sp.]|nr:RNA methyltransferase [Thiobacillus sp.]